MQVELLRATQDDAQMLIEMQKKSFKPLYEKYRDDQTNPYTETVNHILDRMSQPTTIYFKIAVDGEIVGAVRIRELENKRCKLAPIYILPRFQGRGIAQKVFQLIESKFSTAKIWELDTILQESGNCYLYEKMGYKKTGKEEVINDKMTIVYYEKCI